MAEVTPVLKKSSGWQTIGAGKVLHKALRKEDQMMRDFKRRPRAA